MASPGTDRLTLSNLLLNLNQKVFTNGSFAISGLDVQLNDCDLAITLWNRAEGGTIIDTTFSGLTNLISTNGLEKGNWYRFEFENIHLIPGTTLANTEAPGYVQANELENFLVLAEKDDQVSEFVLSEKHKEDIIRYDVTSTLIGASVIPSLGSILFRKDTVRSISGFFDIRNNYVRRKTLDWSSFAFSVSASKFDLVTDVSSPSNVQYTLFDTTVTDSRFFSSNIFTTTTFDGYFPTGGDILKISPVELADIFSKSFVGTVANVAIEVGTNDILIEDTSNVKIGWTCSGISLLDCFSIDIGAESSKITILNSSIVEIKKECEDIQVTSGNKVFIGETTSDVFSTFSNDILVSLRCNRAFFENTYDCEIDNVCTDIIFTDGHQSTIGKFGSNITTGGGSFNKIGGSCANIVVLGGSFNTFEDDCDTINYDTRDGAGDVVYDIYSPMKYMTFKKGCKNIQFNQPVDPGSFQVSTTTFGENCENMIFEDTLTDTTFSRSTKNKTFQIPMSFTEFLGGSDISATITASELLVHVMDGTIANDGGSATYGINAVINDTAAMDTIPGVFGRVFRWHYSGFPETLGLQI